MDKKFNTKNDDKEKTMTDSIEETDQNAEENNIIENDLVEEKNDDKKNTDNNIFIKDPKAS